MKPKSGGILRKVKDLNFPAAVRAEAFGDPAAGPRLIVRRAAAAAYRGGFSDYFFAT
jgi:hypothetical protein